MLVPVPVTEVMTPTVETVSPDRSIAEIATRLHDAAAEAVVVVRDGEPVGIVTEPDVVSVLAEDRNEDVLTADDCMSAPVITVPGDASVERAAELLDEHGVELLPVTDGDDLVGIVSATDISRALPRLAEQAAGVADEEDGPRKHRRVDTAYEADDWEFESLGMREDHIDLGDVVRFTKTLTDADVRAFADACGDTNRVHLDATYADETRFGQRIVHGTLVVGIISAALARLPGLIIYLSQDVTYLGPVTIGDRVTAICEVVEDLGENRYRLETSVRDGDGTEVVEGEAVVLADPIPDGVE